MQCSSIMGIRDDHRLGSRDTAGFPRKLMVVKYWRGTLDIECTFSCLRKSAAPSKAFILFASPVLLAMLD